MVEHLIQKFEMYLGAAKVLLVTIVQRISNAVETRRPNSDYIPYGVSEVGRGLTSFMLHRVSVRLGSAMLLRRVDVP